MGKSTGGDRPRRSSPPPIAVMLVDDHPLWLESLRQVLEHKHLARVIATASDGIDALAQAATVKPEVVVMDIDLPSLDGIDVTHRLVAAQPASKVLMLSASDDPEQVVEAVRAGACGYLLKTSRSDEITDAVRRVHHGELVFPPALAGVVLAALRKAPQSTAARLRVVVADDAVLRREGLTRVLESVKFDVRAVGRVEELAAMIARDPSDVAVVALGARSPSEQELRSLKELRRADSAASLLILAEGMAPRWAIELMGDRPGGFGYLHTERISKVDELTDALRRLVMGESVVDPEMVRSLVGRHPRGSPLDELTPGEKDVLALMAQGRSNKAICERLVVSPKTVEARVGSMFAKLGLEPASDDHRRVLAVLAYLRMSAATG